MLRHLSIENFAIVEKLELSLNNGLSIISGETGAGKSIVVDALSLVLGARADSTVVRQDCETAQINATFTISAITQTWLQQQNLINDDMNTCSVRRVVNQNGRSRGYINNQAVSMQTLRELGELLIDIHGQHAHQSLLRHEVQRQLLDDAAADRTTLQQVIKAYQQWKTLQIELITLGGLAEDRDSRLTLLRYQVQELEGLELTPNAIQQLDEEHRRLAHIHQLLANSQQALALLNAEDAHSTLSQLNQALSLLNEARQHDDKLSNISNLLDSALIQTQEAVSELRTYLEQLDNDPSRLQQVEQQIALLQAIARKHKVRFADLPSYFQRLTTQLHELENYAERAASLDVEIAEALTIYQNAAEQLHEQRVHTAKKLAELISVNMQQLGMPGGELVIAVSADEDAPPSATGMDMIEFLVSTNPGHAPKPLYKVASGGELSRISLAIQVITAQSSGVPTLIFDEVDVGIGGGVAEIVGQLLRHLGQQRQVLCVTHLPQVAAQGHHHWQVQKITQHANTHTHVNLLDEQQRVTEIARMLGGVAITAQTLAHAREMLQLMPST